MGVSRKKFNFVWYNGSWEDTQDLGKILIDLADGPPFGGVDIFYVDSSRILKFNFNLILNSLKAIKQKSKL